MFFIYVYTEASDNVGGDPTPITVSNSDRISCVIKEIDVMRRLIKAEGLDWDTVTRIDVEVNVDICPDWDNPETVTCYTR